jgi:hypothetical protein
MPDGKQSRAEFIVGAPLYAEIAVTDKPTGGGALEELVSPRGGESRRDAPPRIKLPLFVRRHCDSEGCNAVLQWDVETREPFSLFAVALPGYVPWQFQHEG